MPRHICMVGTAGSRVSAPVDNPDIEIWGVSDRGKMTRADRWFELHPIENSFDRPGEAAAWRTALKEFTKDIPELWMMFPEPELHSKVVTYPLDKIKARFNTFHMTSTFSWMMALAIEEMAPRGQFAEPGSQISIYGVDMEAGTEYSEQRAGFQAMMSIAKELGISVNRVLSGGLIYEPVPYPFWQIDPLLCKIDYRLRGATDALAKINEGLISCRTARDVNQGAIGELEFMQKAATVAKFYEGEDNPPKPYDAEERLAFLKKQDAELQATSAKMSSDYVGWSSVEDTLKWLRGYLMP
jgi:hypothetical protein